MLVTVATRYELCGSAVLYQSAASSRTITGFDQSDVENVIEYTPAWMPSGFETTWKRGSVLDSWMRGSLVAVMPTVNYQSKFYNFANSTRVTNSAALLFLGGQQLNMASYGVAVIPAYTLADLRIEANHIGGSNFDLALNATNLFNKHYFAGGNGSVFLFGFEQRVWGAPRMVTVEAKLRF